MRPRAGWVDRKETHLSIHREKVQSVLDDQLIVLNITPTFSCRRIIIIMHILLTHSMQDWVRTVGTCRRRHILFDLTDFMYWEHIENLFHPFLIFFSRATFSSYATSRPCWNLYGKSKQVVAWLGKSRMSACLGRPSLFQENENRVSGGRKACREASTLLLSSTIFNYKWLTC